MKIDAIKPYPNNSKKHDKKQIQRVADSIKRFGFVQPIVVDKNNEVVIGHCRLLAAKLLGLKDVPTISVEKLSEEEVKILLKENRLEEFEELLKIIDEPKFIYKVLIEIPKEIASHEKINVEDKLTIDIIEQNK